MIAKELLVGHDWRAVFYFGTAFTAMFIPLVFFFVPESVYWLARKQPANALEKINKTLRRMGHAAISELPVIAPAARKRSFTDIFSPGLLAITILVAITYFFHVTTFYFIIKWIPKLVNEMHFPASSAAGVLVWANVGGALGGATLGLLTQKFGVKGLTMGAMVLSTVMVILFGRSPPELGALSLICACAGFFTNGAIVGMYAIFARAFPTHVRASGTGVAIGIGRGGSVLAPIAAGFLLNGGVSRATVSLIMAFGSLVAAIILSRVKLRPDVAEHLPDARDASPLEGATTA